MNTTNTQKNKQTKIFSTVIGIFLAAIITIGATGLLGKNNSEAVTTSVAVNSSSTSSASQSSSKYKDGAYSATGSYQTPGGTQSINVSLTLKNDIVTAATVVANSSDNESLQYQDRFIASFKQYVIGKDISTLSVSRIAGASLTSTGFNNAVTSIKTEALA